MSLSIHNLKPGKGATRKRKRVGRGNASGHGTYSTRGLKGQKARSGVSGLKRKGMRQVLLRTPKKRGFTSLREKARIVQIEAINAHFRDNEAVTPDALMKKGLVKRGSSRIKIIGSGALKAKNLRFSGVAMSESVAKQAAGGKAENK